MIKKNFLITALFLVVFFVSQSLHAQSTNPEADKITGIWLSESKDRKFEVYKTKDNLYEAKLIWSSDNKPAGKVILKDLRFDNGSFNGGRIYAPANGEWVKCKAKLENEKTLIVTGSKGMFSKSQTWTK